MSLSQRPRRRWHFADLVVVAIELGVLLVLLLLPLWHYWQN